MRKRAFFPMLAPFTISQTKCPAVAALPPLPATNKARLASRASFIHSIACTTRPVSMVEREASSFSRYSVGKDITRSIVARAAGMHLSYGAFESRRDFDGEFLYFLYAFHQ